MMYKHKFFQSYHHVYEIYTRLCYFLKVIQIIGYIILMLFLNIYLNLTSLIGC